MMNGSGFEQLLLFSGAAMQLQHHILFQHSGHFEPDIHAGGGVLVHGWRRLDRQYGRVRRRLFRAEEHGEDRHLTLAEFQRLLDGRVAGVVPPVGQDDDAEQFALAGAGALQAGGQRQVQVGEIGRVRQGRRLVGRLVRCLGLGVGGRGEVEQGVGPVGRDFPRFTVKAEQFHVMLGGQRRQQANAVVAEDAAGGLGARHLVGQLADLVVLGVSRLFQFTAALRVVAGLVVRQPTRRSFLLIVANPGVELGVAANVGRQVQGAGQAQLVHRRSLRVGHVHAVGAVHGDEDAAAQLMGLALGDDGLQQDEEQQQEEDAHPRQEQEDGRQPRDQLQFVAVEPGDQRQRDQAGGRDHGDLQHRTQTPHCGVSSRFQPFHSQGKGNESMTHSGFSPQSHREHREEQSIRLSLCSL